MKLKPTIQTSRLLWKRLHYLYKNHPRKYNASTLSTTFNSKPPRKFSFYGGNEGLFTIPELKTPDGFRILEERCLLEVDSLMQEACDPHRKRKIVSIFDDMSDSICRVADMVEFVRISHPDPNYRYAAEQTCLTMSELVERLNTNTAIYEALKKAVDEGDIQPMSDVDYRVSQLFKFDFEQSGIHLDAKKRYQFVEINNLLMRISNNFMVASQQPTPEVDIELAPELDQHFRQNLFQIHKGMMREGLQSDHMSEKIRELSYRTYLYPNPDTEMLLNDMLKQQLEMAKITGFKSFADRALKGTLAESPENVMKFLLTLAENLKPGADKEYKIMQQMKANEKSVNPENVRDPRIMPWDPPYYSSLCRQKVFQYRLVRHHFSLGSCMDGLNMLFESLFNVRLDVEELQPGEVWNNDIQKLAVVHNTEGVLGYIYCDFFERADKPNQDCHFTIQGGRETSSGEYQLPVVVIHLNFKPRTMTYPTLLSPAQVENLFHEFGHAMHSMLGRTHYQHVTGTRCPIDFAEIPSVLMEYFVSDPRVVQKYAVDYMTGKPLEMTDVMNFCKTKQLFLYSEIQLQVFYGIVDQVYHGPDIFPMKKTTTELLKEIQNKYYGIPYLENTAWQLRFGHLVGYGGKYYSYLMSRAVASRIWTKLFKDDPFNRESGEKYRHQLLAHGGERHPSELIYNLLGEEPTIDMLVKSLTDDLQQRSIMPAITQGDNNS